MIDQRWAIIAHLDVLSALDGEAKCRLVLVDLEAGRAAGDLCVAARQWEKRRDVFSIPTDDLTVSVPVSGEGAAGEQQLTGQVGSTPTPSPEPVASDPPSEEPVLEVSQPPLEAPAPPVEVDPSSAGGEPAEEGLAEDDESAEEARRAELLARFFNLPKTAQQAFRDLHLEDIGDLDVVDAALATLEHPSTLQRRAAERMALDKAHTPKTPDDPEGGPVPAALFEELKPRLDALPEAARVWIRLITMQANETGVPFNAQLVKTERRYRIYCGLISLAEWLATEDEWAAGADEVLNAVLWATLELPEHFAKLPAHLGHTLGSFDAVKAARFAGLVGELIVGRVTTTTDVDTGELRLAV